MVSLHCFASTRALGLCAAAFEQPRSLRLADHCLAQCRGLYQPISGRKIGVQRRSLLISLAASMATSDKSDDPKDFKYMQLWASEDGETHIKECKMTGFDLKIYSSAEQYVKDEFGGQPTKMIFTELSVGLKQELHPCPEVQFVITLSGSWYIETTDGNKYEFQPGEVLFQDNTAKSPANKVPQHYSGTVGDKPCQQFIVQFKRAPEIDNPNPF